MFKTKSTDQIIIEPVSHEDIEANLKVDKDKAVSTFECDRDEKRVLFQIKSRSTGPWSGKKFATVMKGPGKKKGKSGPQPRKRPLELLSENLGLHYQFMTDAALDSGLLPFKTSEIGDFHLQEGLPPGLNRGVEVSERVSIGSRISILDGLTERLLQVEIVEILKKYCHVPSTSCDSAIRKLSEDVRMRMLGKCAAIFLRSEVAQILKDNHGLPQPTKEMSEYVPPSNINEIRQTLKNKNCVILLGPAGVGKSLTAKKLIFAMKKDAEPFDVINESDGPEGVRLRFENSAARYLVYLRDPWGMNKQNSTASLWLTELPGLLREANGDRVFVITSRLDILNIAGGNNLEEGLEGFIQRIDEFKYSEKRLIKILKRKIQGQEPWKMDLVDRNQTRIIRELKFPLSIERFAHHLSELELEEESEIDFMFKLDGKLQELLRKSNMEAISQTVKAQIENWPYDAKSCAMLLWSILSTFKSVSRERLIRIRRVINKRRNPKIELDRFTENMLAGGNLQEGVSGFEAHPMVIEGMRLVAENNVVVAEEMLNELLYLAFDEYKRERDTDLEPDDFFARLITGTAQIISDTGGSSICVEPELQDQLDDYLSLAFLSKDYKHQEFINIVNLASDRRPHLRLLRLLGIKKEQESSLRSDLDSFFGDFGDFGDFGKKWKPPELTDRDIKSIKEDEQSEKFLRIFISEILVIQAGGYEHQDLLPFLRLCGFSLDDEFKEALQNYYYSGRGAFNVTVLIAGALSEELRYNEVFEVLKGEYESIEAWWETEKESFRKAEENELDAGQCWHMQDIPSENYGEVISPISDWLNLRREKEGLSWIKEHPDRELIIKAWPEAIRDRNDVSLEEYREFFSTVPEENHYWALRGDVKMKLRTLSPVIQERLTSLPKSVVIADYCKTYLLFHKKQRLIDVSGLEAEEFPLAVKAELLYQGRLLAEEEEVDVEVLANILSKDTEHFDALVPYILQQNEESSERPRKEIDNSIPESVLKDLFPLVSPELGLLLIPIMSFKGIDITQYVDRLINSNIQKVSDSALELVENTGDETARPFLLKQLDHERYFVRRKALALVGKKATGEEITRLLKLADDPSAPVREELVDVIRVKESSDVIAVLVKLLMDSRDYENYPDGKNSTHYKIARDASVALMHKDLEPAIVEKLIGLFHNEKFLKTDAQVVMNVLTIIYRYPSKELCNLFQIILRPLEGIYREGFFRQYGALISRIFIPLLLKNPQLLQFLEPDELQNTVAANEDYIAVTGMYISGLVGTIELTQNLLVEDKLPQLLTIFLGAVHQENRGLFESLSFSAGHPLEAISGLMEKEEENVFPELKLILQKQIEQGDAKNNPFLHFCKYAAKNFENIEITGAPKSPFIE